MLAARGAGAEHFLFFPAMQSGNPILSAIDIRIPISVK
jgi:hypothetical protein